MKLVKVSKGLYRTVNGGTTITHRPWAIGERQDTAKEKPWLVRVKTVLAGEYCERFRTFAEARASLL